MTEREKLIDLLQNIYTEDITKFTNYMSDCNITVNRPWIPTDKKLPNTDGCFEVTVKGFKGKHYVTTCQFNKNATYNKWDNELNVVAWRRRDIPYGYKNATDKSFIDFIAEDLLEHGVLVLPVKVGDTVYTNVSWQGWYLRDKDKPYKATVVFIGINDNRNYMNVVYEKNDNMMSFSFDEIGNKVFINREEAEKALKEREEKE